jgi:predicted transcriptional regulator
MKKTSYERGAKIIEVLSQTKDGLDCVELAKIIGVAKTTMRNYCRELFEAGLVLRSERQVSKTHRVYVYLPSGREFTKPRPEPFVSVGDVEAMRKIALHQAWVSEDNGVRLGSYYPMWG